MQEIEHGAEQSAFVIGVAGGTGSGKTTVCTWSLSNRASATPM